MKLGSLFSGIDGLALGFEWAGFDTRWQVENDADCIKVLEKWWPDVHRETDIHGVDFTQLERVDCIVGGFPCQPFSHAGRRSGTDDDRYLWPQMLRAIREQRPTFVVAENVYGLVTIQSGLVLETVYLDLEALGYEVAPPIVFPAAAVGAYHRRDRTWVCAHARQGSYGSQQEQQQEEWAEDYAAIRPLASYSHEARQQDAPAWPQRLRQEPDQRREGIDWAKSWPAEPSVGRVVNGTKQELDGVEARLKMLGNSVVPQAAYMVAKALMESRRA